MDADDEPIRFSRSVILKIIQKYRDLSCLWSRESDGYTDKATREAAWKELTELVQQYEPRANRVHVHKKIESLRACHRKERLKVEKGFSGNKKKKYKARLWYYQEMSFLNGYDVRRPRGITWRAEGSRAGAGAADASESDANSINNDTLFLDVAHNSDDDDDDVVQECPTEDYTEDNDPSNQRLEAELPLSLLEPSDLYGNPSSRIHSVGHHKMNFGDQYDAIGVNVAAKLRNLPSNMRIICEKLINDVLFAAQMNTLTPKAKIVNDNDPFKYERV